MCLVKDDWCSLKGMCQQVWLKACRWEVRLNVHGDKFS